MSELQDTQEYEFGKEFAALVHLCSLSYDGEAIVKHNFDYAFKHSLKKIVIKYASIFNENMKMESNPSQKPNKHSLCFFCCDTYSSIR